MYGPGVTDVWSTLRGEPARPTTVPGINLNEFSKLNGTADRPNQALRNVIVKMYAFLTISFVASIVK